MITVELWVLTDGSRIYWSDSNANGCLSAKEHKFPNRDDLKVIKLTGVF